LADHYEVAVGMKPAANYPTFWGGPTSVTEASASLNAQTGNTSVQYFVRVTPVNATDNGDASEVQVLQPIPPGPVAGLNAVWVEGNTKIQVSWIQEQGVSYKIEGGTFYPQMMFTSVPYTDFVGSTAVISPYYPYQTMNAVRVTPIKNGLAGTPAILTGI
jgi:hypothetical protein